jgi:hypothetical protein
MLDLDGRATRRATVSILRRGDDDMHYSDGSHRWIAPPGINQAAWEAGLRAHQSLHLTTMGGPVKIDELRQCRLPHIPRQRGPQDEPVQPNVSQFPLVSEPEREAA